MAIVESGSSTLRSTKQEYKAVDETEINDQTLECAKGDKSDYEDLVGDIYWEDVEVKDDDRTAPWPQNTKNALPKINSRHVSCL